ncbi:efflux RND transporter periplasmic adaptor subunit [Marispirochaeta aestuarii]|uniref:efflux RND transporter periplasmic adaptor subunit n=1 Tax=Marispirochaeta aestuarii TaxID=1963862 RepID=UPI0029C8F3A9|nr:efflux RND transporter periplasmic adaptor subunit [Marispirochaeta aestuarii]
MKNKTKLLIAILAVLLLGGAAVGFFWKGDTVEAVGDSPAEEQIAVIEAQSGKISVSVEGPSRVEPYRLQDIRSQISGSVTEARLEGDEVGQGEVLVRFDDTDLRSALRQAELNLQQARVDLEKVELELEEAEDGLAEKESLFASGSITRDQRDAARAAARNASLGLEGARIRLSQSELSRDLAQEALNNASVAAPYNGVVLASNVSAGDVASSNSVLMSFADVSRLRLRAEVDEFDIGKVKIGMPVRITADALGSESLQSVVERVSPAAEVVNNISIFTVSTVIPASDGGLRPGMSADLTILISDDSGIIVPRTAVSSVRGRFYLDVWENDEVVTKRVVAGADDGTNVVITEGLAEGEKVVVPTGGGFSLISGAAESAGTSIIPVTVPGSGGR